MTSAIRRTLSSAPGPRGGGPARRRASTALPLRRCYRKGPNCELSPLLDAFSDAMQPDPTSIRAELKLALIGRRRRSS